jgi:hypothetical protein
MLLFYVSRSVSVCVCFWIMFLAAITVISTPKRLSEQRLIYGDVEESAGEDRKSGKRED